MINLALNLLATAPFSLASPALLAADSALALKGFAVVALGVILGIAVVIRPSRRKPPK